MGDLSRVELPPYFHAVLTPISKRAPRGRVVLLHGWNQCHRSWLRTATILRDKLHLEVLLIDFYNHGESPTLPERRLHCAEVFCGQVRSSILRAGWENDRLAVGGCSLGGSVALHYFSQWPRNVAKVILV